VIPIFGTDFLASHPIALAGVIAATAVTLYWITRRRWRTPTLALGVAWLALSLLPTLPLMAIDLYLYFGSIGFAMMLAPFFARPPIEGVSAVPRWKNAALVAYLALYGLSFTARGLFYRIQGDISRRAFDDIALERAPLLDGTRLLMVNMPLPASHLASMSRVLTGQSDVTALLVSISPEWAAPTHRARVQCLDDHHVRVLPPEGSEAFFRTPEEWNLQLLHRPIDPTRTYRKEGVTVQPVVENHEVVALEITLDRSLGEGRDRIYSFYDDGERLAHRVCGPSSAMEARR